MDLKKYTEDYREAFPNIVCDIVGCENISAAYDDNSNYISKICDTCCKDPKRDILCPYCHAQAYLIYNSSDNDNHFIDCKVCDSIYITPIDLADHPF